MKTHNLDYLWHSIWQSEGQEGKKRQKLCKWADWTWQNLEGEKSHSWSWKHHSEEPLNKEITTKHPSRTWLFKFLYFLSLWTQIEYFSEFAMGLCENCLRNWRKLVTLCCLVSKGNRMHSKCNFSAAFFIFY